MKTPTNPRLMLLGLCALGITSLSAQEAPKPVPSSAPETRREADQPGPRPEARRDDDQRGGPRPEAHRDGGQRGSRPEVQRDADKPGPRPEARRDDDQSGGPRPDARRENENGSEQARRPDGDRGPDKPHMDGDRARGGRGDDQPHQARRGHVEQRGSSQGQMHRRHHHHRGERRPGDREFAARGHGRPEGRGPMMHDRRGGPSQGRVEDHRQEGGPRFGAPRPQENHRPQMGRPGHGPDMHRKPMDNPRHHEGPKPPMMGRDGHRSEAGRPDGDRRPSGPPMHRSEGQRPEGGPRPEARRHEDGPAKSGPGPDKRGDDHRRGRDDGPPRGV